jgi:hypothetical protein
MCLGIEKSGSTQPQVLSLRQTVNYSNNVRTWAVQQRTNDQLTFGPRRSILGLATVRDGMYELSASSKR